MAPKSKVSIAIAIPAMRRYVFWGVRSRGANESLICEQYLGESPRSNRGGVRALLVIGVALAFLISTQMVSRSQSNPGFLVKKWVAIITAIGADRPTTSRRDRTSN